MSGVGLGGGSWIGSGSGGGVSNAANVGVGGVGPFESLSAGVLNFKTINAGSDKVTVTDDTANKEVDIDVDETKLNVRNLTNVSPGSNGTFTGWSDTGQLASVPGFTFDDIGTLRVGAQNSITVPAGVTDYYSIGISPTISNPGLTNLSGVQLNSPMNATVTNYSGFTLNGYGTGVPLNYLGFSSNANYSGTGTSATHFDASSPWDITGALTGFKLNAGGDAQYLQGFELTATGSYTSVSGLKIDLGSATSTDRKTGIEVTEGTFASTVTFSTTSSLPTLVDSGNILRPIFEVKAGSPITGTDVLMSNLAGFMDIKDDHSGSVLGLGVASVGFVSQVAVASGKTMDKVTMCLGAISIDATSTGGDVTDAQIFNALAANFGGSLSVKNLYGFRMEDGTSAHAITTWGICIDDLGAENYIAKSLKVGGATKTVSHPSIALEVDGTRSMRIPVLTTAQRTALPDITGTMCFDSDTLKGYLNDGSGWHQFA